MSPRELNPLRAVLQRAVAAARLPVRTVEEALGLPKGGWERLVAGGRILRVYHLLALARLLDVPPGDFLDLALPEANRAADLRLADWFTPSKPRFKPPVKPPEPAPDWQTMIRDAVRRELKARK
jgi:transcriptional regulator with XRE-family HTH domain